MLGEKPVSSDHEPLDPRLRSIYKSLRSLRQKTEARSTFFGVTGATRATMEAALSRKKDLPESIGQLLASVNQDTPPNLDPIKISFICNKDNGILEQGYKIAISWQRTNIAEEHINILELSIPEQHSEDVIDDFSGYDIKTMRLNGVTFPQNLEPPFDKDLIYRQNQEMRKMAASKEFRIKLLQELVAIPLNPITG